MEKHKTVLGINENLEGALCYVLFFISGIFFLIMEKESKFVRFHAMQSTVVFLILFIVWGLLGWIPILGLIITLILRIGGIILWLFLMYMAFKGEKFMLPVIGDFVEEQLGKKE